MQDYVISISVNMLDGLVVIECPSIHYMGQYQLQKDTIGYVLASPVKLIASEIKRQLAADEKADGQSTEGVG